MLEFIMTIIGFVLGAALIGLLGGFLYLVVKFIYFVPKYLKRIAEALEAAK